VAQFHCRHHDYHHRCHHYSHCSWKHSTRHVLASPAAVLAFYAVPLRVLWWRPMRREWHPTVSTGMLLLILRGFVVISL
jgi:hypothetical protein